MITKSNKCKCPNCENLGTKSQKGYCKNHYKKLLEKSKLYYEEIKQYRNTKTKDL